MDKSDDARENSIRSGFESWNDAVLTSIHINTVNYVLSERKQ